VKFDEQAASEELERTRQALEESRQRRKRASEEFDAFLRSFASPGSAPPPAGSAPAVPPRRLVREPSAPLVPHEQGAAGEPAPVPSSAPPEPPAPSPLPIVVTALGASPRPRHKARVYGGIALAAGAVAIVAWRVRSPEPAPTTARPVAAAAAPAAPQPGASTPSSSPAPGAPRQGVSAELRTTRPVWVRVTVDGKQVLERELAADQRLPFTAVRTVTIRAGDAGAVRVSLNGADQGTLGPDGQVVTRSFARPD
jgi:hypothetical protein